MTPNYFRTSLGSFPSSSRRQHQVQHQCREAWAWASSAAHRSSCTNIGFFAARTADHSTSLVRWIVRVRTKTWGGSNQDFPATLVFPRLRKKINSAALWEGPTCRRSAARLRKRELEPIFWLKIKSTKRVLRKTRLVALAKRSCHGLCTQTPTLPPA